MGGYQLASPWTSSAAATARASNIPHRHAEHSRSSTDSRFRPSIHVFLPGHRIMVQIQSSWFPLYDRNPQTFVPNIMFAKPSDYRRATQRVYHAGRFATSIELPLPQGN